MQTDQKLNLLLLVLITFLSLPPSRPQSSNLPSILRNVFKIKDNGGYYFQVDTSDFHHEALGEVNNNVLSVKGYYSYTGTDGVNNVIEYVADENGFRPKQPSKVPQPLPSSSLPTPTQPSFPGPPHSPIVPPTLPLSPPLPQPPTPPPSLPPPPGPPVTVPPVLAGGISGGCAASLCGTGIG